MRLFLVLLALFLLFTLAAACGADTVGTANADGYRLAADGYYRFGNSPQAYYRTLITTPGFWQYGRYYSGSSYYQYNAYTPPSTVKAPTYRKFDWKEDLLKAAAQRDDHLAFLAALKAAGFAPGSPQGYAAGGYGTVPGYMLDGNASHSVTNFGANASTVYGYSSVANLYRDTDLQQLYQSSAQLTAGAQALAGQANTGFQGLVGLEGQNRARVAEIIAKGQMAQQVLAALVAGPSQETKGFSFRITPQGIERVEQNVDPAVKTGLAQQFATLVNDRCIACHSTQAKKGGFDIGVYPTMSPQAKQAVWQRLTTPDEEAVMPRAGDGKAGKRLTPEELRLFLLN